MKTVLKVIAFIFITFFFSYYTFMSAQGLLIAISKEGALFYDCLGMIINLFLIPSLFIYLYKYFFNNGNSKRHSIYLLCVSSLAFIMMLINTITWTNWGIFGPSILYPIDFLTIDFLSLCFTVIVFIKQPKQNRKLSVIKNMALYLLVFIGLDRFGATVLSYSNAYPKDIIMLIPLYLFNITWLLLLAAKELDDKKEELLIGILATTILISTEVYLWLMLLGDNRSEFMKILSVFYGLDRLANMPITFFLLPIINLIYLIIYFGEILHLKAKKL